MGVADIVRSSIATADAILKDLEPTLTHKMWVSQDTYGTPAYKTVKRQGIVDLMRVQVKSPGGESVMSKHRITFVGPVPVSGKDLIYLPDGTTGPILDVSGPIDAGTGKGFITEVLLG